MRRTVFCLSFLFCFEGLSQPPSQSCYEDLFPKQAENKFWGYVNLFDEWKVEPVFTKILPFVGNKAIVEKYGRFGVVGCDGKMIVPADFEEVGTLANGTSFWVKKGGKWSLANEKGELTAAGNIIEIKEVAGVELTWLKTAEETYGLYSKQKHSFLAAPRYSLFQILSEKASIVQYKEKFGVVSHEDGSYLFEPVITSLKKLSAQVIAFEENGKWGILNPKGEVVRTADLDSIGFILNNLYYASKEGKCGLIDAKNQPVLPMEYEKLEPFYEHMALIKRNGSFGYTNLAGRVTVPLMYEWGDIFQNGQAIVKTSAGYFIVDKVNKRVTQQNYKWLVKTPGKGYYAAYRDGKYLFLDLLGKETIPPTYALVIATDDDAFVRVQDSTKKWHYFDVTKLAPSFEGQFEEASKFQYGYAFVKKNGAWGIIDQKGKELTPFRYTSARYLNSKSSLYFLVEENQQKGLLAATGATILPSEYALISVTEDNLFKVKKDGKYGVLNSQGQETSKNKYDVLSNLEENPTLPEWPAIIARKKKYGLLAQNQTEIVELEYQDMAYLGDNFYVFEKEGKKGILAANGKVVVLPYMEEVRPQSEKHFAFKKEGKWGYVFNTGKVMINPQYEEAGDFHQNLALVKLDGKWGVINKQGRWILKNEYTNVQYLPNGKRQLQSALKQIEITEKGILKQVN